MAPDAPKRNVSLISRGSVVQVMALALDFDSSLVVLLPELAKGFAVGGFEPCQLLAAAVAGIYLCSEMYCFRPGTVCRRGHVVT